MGASNGEPWQVKQKEQEARGNFERSLSSCGVEEGYGEFHSPKSGADFASRDRDAVFHCSLSSPPCLSRLQALRDKGESVSHSFLRAQKPSQARHTAGVKQKPAE